MADFFANNQFQFNEEDVKKLKEVEAKIQLALDANTKLKIENQELKKCVDSIRKEVASSFDQMREIVKNYQKKHEEAKSKSTVTTSG